jgi:hypothetical protein
MSKEEYHAELKAAGRLEEWGDAHGVTDGKVYRAELTDAAGVKHVAAWRDESELKRWQSLHEYLFRKQKEARDAK